MKKLYLSFALVICFVQLSHAQLTIETKVYDFLHANDFKAAVGNYSMNFWNYKEARSFVPFTGPESPSTIFASALWLSAEDENGRVFTNTETYGGFPDPHFFPGPLPEIGQIPTKEDVLNFNTIFKVTSSDILAHIDDAQDGTIDHPQKSIYGWPAVGNEHFEDIHGFQPNFGPEGGAHFIELPGSENGIYEPHLGEYPHVESLTKDVVPGEITWVVYNTAHNQNMKYGIDSSLVLEIHQTSYAFDCDDAILKTTIFHDYKVISRSKVHFPKFHFGLWMDPDLGCFTDDYVGCDPSKNSFYIYNSDSEDGTVDGTCQGDIPTYGSNPPVQSVTFLNKSLDAFVLYNNSAFGGFPATSDPRIDHQYHLLMNATWLDGTPMTKGGSGYDPQSSNIVHHLFPDNPNDDTGWSMHTAGIEAGDRRTIGVHNSQLSPNSVLNFTVAFSYHNHPDKTFLDNVNYALNRIDTLQIHFDAGKIGCQPELCTCDCVWPGDANHNGQVDYLDAVNIIQGIGHSGSTRDKPFIFNPQEVTDWPNQNFDNVNSKYADVDGNGIINETDLHLLSEYIDQTTYCAEELSENCPEGDAVYLDVPWWDDEFPTTFSTGYITVKSMKDFWGISYTLKYDPAIFGLIDGPHPRSWKDTSLKNLTFIHEKEINELKTHQVVIFNDGARNAAPSQSQDYKASELIFQPPKVPQRYPTSYAIIEICDFTVYYEDGSTEILPAKPTIFKLPDSVVTSTPLIETKVNSINIFPNPGTGTYSVESSEKIKRVEVYNSVGQLIHQVADHTVHINSIFKGVLYFKVFDMNDNIAIGKVIQH